MHQAYLPIVAASTRAATLHYCCNDREFAWGPLAVHDQANHAEFARATDGARQLRPQVLLIDAGCEWDNYAADSTCHCKKSTPFSMSIERSYTDDARGKWG